MKVWSKSGEDVSKTIEEFTSGKDVALDKGLLQYDIAAGMAHAKMLHKIGVVSEAELAELLAALEKAKSMELDPSLEDVHANVEAFVTKETPAGKKLHTARSRNDLVATDMLMYSKDSLVETSKAMEELAGALQSLPPLPMPGFTHMQKAMPTTLEHWGCSHAESLVNDCEYISATIKVIDKCPLGACAGFGSVFPVDREMLAEELGFSGVHWNTLSAVASRGKNTFLALNALAAVGLDLSKLAQDLLLLYLLGMVSFKDAVCTGSSVMPHKKNCDALELVKAKAGVVLGLQAAALGVCVGLPSGYNRDEQETKKLLMQAFGEIIPAIKAATEVVGALEPDAEKMLAECGGEVLATDKAALEALKGTPWRDAYKSGGGSISVGDSIGLKKVLGFPGNPSKPLKKKETKS
ncbi:MAG: argininosuccinate lyase [Candidatus Diapherotrites archaeon]|nr:argininosuccinate lyase [Candidatus Diapherotrites archaeon]